PGHGGAQADDLGTLVGRAGSVPELVHGVEVTLDPGSVLVREYLQRQVDGDGVLLTDVAHVGRPLDGDDVRSERRVGDGRPALVLELAVDPLDLGEGRRVEPGEPRANEVVAEIGEEHAEGREDPGRAGNDHAPDAQLPGYLDAVERAGAAVGDEGEVADVEPA